LVLFSKFWAGVVAEVLFEVLFGLTMFFSELSGVLLVEFTVLLRFSVSTAPVLFCISCAVDIDFLESAETCS